MKRGTTLKDIAGLAGVSIRTVSLAVAGDGRMSDETRERILRIAKELDYRPDLAAKGLRMRRSFLIGAVFPYLNVSFFNRTIGGIEERCFESGYDILIASPPSAADRAKGHGAGPLDRLIARKVDGIIATATGPDYTHFFRIEEEGIPLLQLLTRAPGLSAPFLGVDNVSGGRMAARHLLELGHERIGFLRSSKSPYMEIEDRFRGYLMALLEAGVKIDPERYSTEAGSLLDPEEARAATAALLGRAPDLTAVFAPTDYAALGAIRACGDAGLRVPEDVSVVGFDDIEIASMQVDRPFTTVSQPKEELGRSSFDMLLSLIEGRAVEDRLVAPSLVVRSTTGSARRRA